MLTLKKKNKFTYEIRLEKFWSNAAAEDAYRLVRYEVDRRDNLTGVIEYLGIGDRDWANRTAKHYDIEVTPQLLEDEAY